MEKSINVEEIKKTTATNILFLSLRNFGIQGISTIGFFLLTILLGTADVGLFAIVAESVSILGYFSDVGLASALIQQKTEILKAELQTTFLIQQSLVIITLLLVFIFYPQIALNRGFGTPETWILISLCFSFFAASLKTIPSVLLERKLNFKLISTIDIIENISFYFFAVLFAYLGYGVYSYAIATFIRSLFGLVTMYIFSPWPIGFSFSLDAAKRLFRFGIPFQLNSFIAMAKDRLSNLFVAGIIGTHSFGILSWAQKGPRMPLSLMDAIMRVTFPTFSRLQDHRELLQKSLQRTLYFIAFFVFPSLAGISLIAPDIINLIPKYTKWLPAIYPLYFFAASAAIAAITTPITNAFNAVGKITTTTKLMIMWTVLTWIFYPILSIKLGYIGTAYAALIVGSSSLIVWWLAQRNFQVNVFSTIFHPLVSSTLMIFLLTFINIFNLSPLQNLSTKILVGISFYFAYHYLFTKSQLSWFLLQLKKIKNV